MKTITIALEEYNSLLEINEKYKCLREHLEKVNEVFTNLGEELNSNVVKSIAIKANPTQTKKQGVEKYKNLITSGERAKKSDHLKKK